MKEPEKFWARVKQTKTCWLWLGGKTSRGYGSVRWKDKTYRAHQIAFILSGGKIPKGLELDHVCANKLCVNPAHLEPVTHRINVLRGNAPSAKFAKRKTCSKGHAYTLENTYRRKGGSRVCRKCANAKNAEHRNADIEANRAYHRAYYARNKGRSA